MKELKFRAWDKKIQQFIDAKETVINDGKIFRNWQDFEDYIPDDGTIELVWFSGLKDSKGKEVHEGDVLRCIFVVWSRSQSFGKTKSDVIAETALVVYEECSYKVRFPDGTTESLFRFDSASEEFEVIGNRFENPELVEDAEWEQK